MASTSEVGHNKNVANFGYTCQIVTEMGALYAPSNPSIKLPALTTVNTGLIGSLQNINQKIPIYRNLVAEREIKMTNLRFLATKIYNFSKSIAISKAEKENVNRLVKKVRGDTKVKMVLDPTDTSSKTISTAQTSYDNTIDFFDKLIDQIDSYPEYIPNEDDLKIVNLKLMYDDLKNLNNEVNASIITLITARKQRNDLLYFNDDNAIRLVRDIKSYLKSLGADALPYYKAVVALKLRKSL
jgi:hypothetical protein